MGLFMSQGKSYHIINPGKIPLESSILFFVLSLFTLPFGIGFILVPIVGSYFIYQVIHWDKHWIHVSRSKIVIHYLFSTETILREDFTGVSLTRTKTGGNSILTLHTNSQRYRFGRVDNPDYLRKIFKQFKDGTLFSETRETKIHPAKLLDTPYISVTRHFPQKTETKTDSVKLHSTLSPPATEQSPQDTEIKIHPAKLLDIPSTSDTENSTDEVLTESERKGKELEDAVFSFISSPGNIPGYHQELRNVYVQRPDGSTTEIDLIMIHDAGIYVFECKNHAGNIYGSVGNNTWAVFYPGGEKHNPPNPIRQNAGHINALSDYLKMQRSCFYSCVVLGSEARLKKVPEDDSHCFISKYQGFEKKLMNQIDHSSVHLSADDIDTIYDCLEPLTKVSDEVKEKHKRDIREKYGDF